MRDGDAGPVLLAAKLDGLLQGEFAPEEFEAAWQDSLDLLAVASGAKPVALIGVGYPAGRWLAEIAALARASGLAVRRGGMPWLVATELAGLPDWYAGPLRDSWAAADILTVSQPGAATRSGDAPVLMTAEQEAELLGYPACCVADHHARRRRYHDLMIELIAMRCDFDTERRRFAASELPPSLRDDADRERLAEALRSQPVAFAGFAPCIVCEALGPRGPAGKRALAMLELAETSGFRFRAGG